MTADGLGEQTRTPLIRVLGPVHLSGPSGPVEVAGALPRAFLGVLALESPRTVSIDRLTSLLWADAAPAGVKAALQQLASRVRRSLAAMGAGDALVARSPGYALDLPPGSVDLSLFRESVRRADDAVRSADSATAVKELEAGLSLWSANALADVADLPLGLVLCSPLDDERWRAEERLAELLLERGDHRVAVGRLGAATSAAPLRESLWVLHARALMAQGSAVDALQCVRSGISVVTALLGVPPGPELAALDAELSARTRVPPTRVAGTSRTVEDSSMLAGAMRKALDKAEQAAIEATRRHALHEAVRHWERALELLDSVDRDDDHTRLRLLMGLGNAHNRVSLDAEARQVFREAVAIARRLDDATAFGLAVLGYCAERNGLSPPPEQIEMLTEALGRQTSDDRLVRGRLSARLAMELYWTDSVDRTLTLAEEALDDAMASGDLEGRLLARHALAFGCWTPARTERLLEELESYLGDALELGDRNHELLAHRWLAVPVVEMGDIARGRREIGRATALADELGNSVQQWMCRQIAAAIEMLAGDLDRAEELANEALVHGTTSEPSISFDYFSIIMWTLAWARGGLAEFLPFVESVANAPGADAARRAALAVTYAETGRVDEARAVLDSLTDDVLDDTQQDGSWFMLLTALGEAAHLCGDARCGRWVERAAAPYTDRLSITSVCASGTVAHAAGLGAIAAGDGRRGVDLLEHSLAVAQRTGAVVVDHRTRAALDAARAAH